MSPLIEVQQQVVDGGGGNRRSAFASSAAAVATANNDIDNDHNEIVTNYTRSFDLGLGNASSSVKTCIDDPHQVEEEGEYSVTSLELFSDLVVVVAIHVIATPLEDEGILANIPWYIIRIFHLWLIWHSATISFHLSHLFKDAENPILLLIALGYMVLVLLLAQNYRIDDNFGALIINMILRAMEVASFAVQVHREPPMHFDSARLAILRMIPNSMVPNFVVTELLPLSLSLIFAVDEQPRMSLVWLSIVLVMAQRTYGAYKVDKIQSDSSKPPVKVFDDHLMKERYELISLIFIGEITFAAAGDGDEWMSVGYCCFVTLTAFGCYLLFFTARQPPKIMSIQEFWSRSGVHIMTGQHLYLGLFASLPAIAAGYMRIAESMEDIEGENPDGDLSCDPASSRLLILSATTFLVFSAFLHSMTKTKREAVMKQWQLVTVRLLWSLICAGLYFFPEQSSCVGRHPVASFAVPAIFFSSTTIEIYGLQEQGYSIVKRLEIQSTVQRTKPIEKGGSSKTLIVYDSSFESGDESAPASIDDQKEII